MIQTEIDWQARRDQGISSSAQHAEQDVPGWGERALEYVRLYAEVHVDASGSSWTMENCRVWATHVGLPEAPEARAWGAVTQKAIRQGIIRKTGQYAPAASSNGSPKPLYVGCV